MSAVNARMGNMHIPTYDDSVAAWLRATDRLREIGDGCLIVSAGNYRPTVLCGGRQVRLARVAYIASGGTIPDDATCLRHTCDDQRCVNPDHQIPGTDLDNARDRRDRGRGGVGWQGEVCYRGHDTRVTGVRLTKRPNTTAKGRICRECERERRPQPSR